jgi:hypothetical protein
VVITNDPIVTVKYPGTNGPGSGGTVGYTAVRGDLPGAGEAGATYDYQGINVYLKNNPPAGSLVSITYYERPDVTVPETGQEVVERQLTSAVPSRMNQMAVQLQQDYTVAIPVKTACIASVPRLFNDPDLREVVEDQQRDREAEKQQAWADWGMWLGLAATIWAFAGAGAGSGESGSGSGSRRRR